MTRLLLLVPLTVFLVPVLVRLRKRHIRNKYPRDYAFHLFHQAPGPDFYSYMKQRMPRLTADRYNRLVLDFRAVDATLTTIVQRQVGEPFSSKPVLLALQQLHPFLKYEGLRQAIRIARVRHANLAKTPGEPRRVEAPRARSKAASSDA
jgi:CTP:molybdopterin cytidylyltransferase MocA